MKVALVLLALVAVAYAAPRPHKRAFMGHIFDVIGDFFTRTYNDAKDAVVDAARAIGQVVTSDQFDRIVDILVAQIDSSYTEAACDTTCVAGAATILGPLASIASTVCHPACSAALAKLEEVAG